MKKIGFALFLFIAVRFSLWAVPGGLPSMFKIENLMTKESVTYRAGDLICNGWWRDYQTPIITFSKGIYAWDKIKITIWDTYGYYFAVFGWTNAYNSQQESVLEMGNENAYIQEASISYMIPATLEQDNMSMDICAYVSFPVGLKGDGDVGESESLFRGTRYCFRFSGIHNTKRYTIREDLGDIIIIKDPIVPPHTLSNKSTVSAARLYDVFGNLKKTVSLNNSGETRIYVGDLKHGMYLLKLSIDGMEFTEKINL